MSKKIIICLSIFFSLAISRLIPHPPNFTNLIALSFYIPVFLGVRYLPVLLLSFALTDFIIGYHLTTHWTWGSIFLIGLLAKFVPNNVALRLAGASLSSLIFFVITNFGVWTSGLYEQTFAGLQKCFILALPFFQANLISTLIFSIFFEIAYKLIKSFFLFKKI